MRKPKTPGTKRTAKETTPPGGRAWERAKQFALERGLPTVIVPSDEAVPPPAAGASAPRSRILKKAATKKAATKKVATKRTPQRKRQVR
jgi:hypothetical protein